MVLCLIKVIRSQSYLSTKAPNVQPNSSVYFSLSNINNPYSQPSSIIYSLVAQGVVGELIRERPPQFMWNKMIDGAYNQLTLTFLGTDLQPIVIQDPSMTILLTIKEGDLKYMDITEQYLDKVYDDFHKEQMSLFTRYKKWL